MCSCTLKQNIDDKFLEYITVKAQWHICSHLKINDTVLLNDISKLWDLWVKTGKLNERDASV